MLAVVHVDMPLPESASKRVDRAGRTEGIPGASQGWRDAVVLEVGHSRPECDRTAELFWREEERVWGGEAGGPGRGRIWTAGVRETGLIILLGESRAGYVSIKRCGGHGRGIYSRQTRGLDAGHRGKAGRGGRVARISSSGPLGGKFMRAPGGREAEEENRKTDDDEDEDEDEEEDGG